MTNSKKCEEVGLKQFKDPNGFMEHLNDMNTVWKIIEEQSQSKKQKLLIVFHDIAGGMISTKKIYSVVTKLLIRHRKLKNSVTFITQSYFRVPKNVRLNTTYFFAI